MPNTYPLPLPIPYRNLSLTPNTLYLSLTLNQIIPLTHTSTMNLELKLQALPTGLRVLSGALLDGWEYSHGLGSCAGGPLTSTSPTSELKVQSKRFRLLSGTQTYPSQDQGLKFNTH